MNPSKKRSSKSGLPPGSLVPIGSDSKKPVEITIFDFDQEDYLEKKPDSIQECFPFKEKPTVTWINIDGIHDVEVVKSLGERFDLHPLLMEDLLNTGQRPKLEEFEDYLFIVLKMLQYDEENRGLDTEQVSLVLGENFVLSFQEKPGDLFDPIRERIRSGKGRIRQMKADYLVYALMDAVVDNYFLILEEFSEDIEDLEEELVDEPKQDTVKSIHKLKQDLINLRKSIWPLREVVAKLEKNPHPLIDESTGIYFRDVYDHTIQVMDTVESFRDIVSGMLDIYLTSISNKMNEVMKVLTVIATIFIPLTFIAGVYGMNFQYMPELEYRWGYPLVLMVMFLIGLSMYGYFRRKNWL